MALGGIVVLAAIIGGIVVLAGGDDSADTDAGSDGAAPELTQVLNEKAAGIEAAYPEGWKRTDREGIVNLESPDRCVAIALSAPVPARLSTRLLRDSVAAVGRSFRKAEARVERSPPPIGGAPTASALLAVRKGKGGQPVAIRVAVSRGKRLAHLIQVVIRDPRCEGTIEQSGQIIDSIGYTR